MNELAIIEKIELKLFYLLLTNLRQPKKNRSGNGNE